MTQTDQFPTKRFFELLHRGGQWAYLWTSDNRRSAWFPVGKPIPHLRGKALYFGVHPIRAIPTTTRRGFEAQPFQVRGRIEDAECCNCLFAEFDAKDYGDKAAITRHIKDIASLSPPTFTIDSGGGYHTYWLLKTTNTDIAQMKDLQARWVAYVGGDVGAHDLARVLRVPGSFNHKYDPPRPVHFVDYNVGRTYDLAKLTKGLPPPPPPKPRAVPLPGMQVESRHRAYVQATIRNCLQDVRNAPQGRRNTALNQAAFSLAQLIAAAWAGLAEVEIEQILIAVGLEIGLSEQEVLATVDSGIEAGLEHPRGFPHGKGQQSAWDVLADAVAGLNN